MAKKKSAKEGDAGGVNKAQAIRDEFSKQGIDARPRDVIAALGAQGIEVSAAQVSNVKAKLVEQQGGGAPARATATSGRGRGGRSEQLTLGELMQVKQMVDGVGGVAKAKQALEALEKLR